MTTPWLILAYLAGDNDLDSELLADLHEMERVGSRAGAVEIVAQIDDPSGTRRYHVVNSPRPDVIGSTLLADLGHTNTGDPQVLADFIEFGATRVSARATMLIVATHGWGLYVPQPVSASRGRRLTYRRRADVPTARGLAYDDGSADCLDNRELSQVLAQGHARLGRPVDILGLDACLMAMLEVAYQMREHARILVASQAIEPRPGWPYAAVLGDLVARPMMTAPELATTIVRRHAEAYAGGHLDVTQSAIDLSKLDDVVDAVDRLARALLGGLPSRSLDLALYTAWRGSLRFFEGRYVDLHDFAGNLRRATGRRDVRHACIEIQGAIEADDGPIIAEQHVGPRMAPATGLSIYCPLYHSPLSAYRDLDFARRTRWADFLDVYVGPAAILAAH